MGGDCGTHRGKQNRTITVRRSSDGTVAPAADGWGAQGRSRLLLIRRALSTVVSSDLIEAMSESLDRTVISLGGDAEGIADGRWRQRPPADLLSSLDDRLRAQRLIVRCKNGYDELEDPARPRLKPRRLGSRKRGRSGARDLRCDLGQLPKLDPDFRVRTCARQLYCDRLARRRSNSDRGMARQCWF